MTEWREAEVAVSFFKKSEQIKTTIEQNQFATESLPCDLHLVWLVINTTLPCVFYNLGSNSNNSSQQAATTAGNNQQKNSNDKDNKNKT
eukprot:6475461-Amphidinium_carterae.1